MAWAEGTPRRKGARRALGGAVLCVVLSTACRPDDAVQPPPAPPAPEAAAPTPGALSAPDAPPDTRLMAIAAALPGRVAREIDAARTPYPWVLALAALEGSTPVPPEPLGPLPGLRFALRPSQALPVAIPTTVEMAVLSVGPEGASVTRVKPASRAEARALQTTVRAVADALQGLRGDVQLVEESAARLALADPLRAWVGPGRAGGERPLLVLRRDELVVSLELVGEGALVGVFPAVPLLPPEPPPAEDGEEVP